MKANLNDLSSEKLIEMLNDKNPTIVCQAICELTNRPQHSSIEFEQLQKLCDNKTPFWNDFLISDFAEASLDILGQVKYTGNKNEVKRLIESKLDFN